VCTIQVVVGVHPDVRRNGRRYEYLDGPVEFLLFPLVRSVALFLHPVKPVDRKKDAKETNTRNTHTRIYPYAHARTCANTQAELVASTAAQKTAKGTETCMHAHNAKVPVVPFVDMSMYYVDKYIMHAYIHALQDMHTSIHTDFHACMHAYIPADAHTVLLLFLGVESKEQEVNGYTHIHTDD